MPDYDPHSPAIVGCEWPGSRQRVLPIGTGNLAGARILSTATETVPSIYTLVRTPAGPQPIILCDVYDLANDPHPPDELVLAPPVDCYRLDQPSPGAWHTWIAGVHGGSSDPAVTHCVDDVVGDNDPGTASTNDALVIQSHPMSSYLMFNASGALYHGADGSSGASITGKRIKYVEVIALLSNQSAGPVTVVGALQGSSQLGLEGSAPQVIPAGQGARLRFRFLTNAAVGGLPWDRANLEPYLTAAAGFGIGVLAKPGAGWLSLYAVEFGVHVCTEARVAKGYGFAAPGADYFCPIGMCNVADITDAQSWAKVNGHAYYVAVTAIRAPSAVLGVSSYGVANPRLLLLPTTQLETMGLGAEGMGVPVTDLIGDIDAMHCLLTVGSGYSVDSNVYASVAPAPLGATSPTHRQDMTGSGTFGTCGVLVAGDGTQDDDITIQLKRGSSVLASATIATSDPDAPRDGRPTLVRRALSAPVTFSGGEYLQVSSSSTRPWSLPCMFTRGVNVDAPSMAIATAAAARGIGGSADSADTVGTADFPWWVGTIPNAPTGLTATKQNFTTTNKSPGGPARISYAALDWTSTSLGGSFDHYEVLRNGNVIAAITAEASSYYNDFEGKRGVASSYTVRVVRDDGAVSVVSAAAVVTVDSPGVCDVVLCTNSNPDLTLAYQSAPGHAYGRPSSDLANPILIGGRAAPFVVRPLTEGNADTFSHVYTIQINTPVQAAPTTIDRAVFAPLVKLIEWPGSYVAVCQGNGDRWFASGKLGKGSMVFSQPGNAHRATVEWNEVDTLPAVHVVATPWHP